jgi:oligoribonuclease (3'-5' exoribonuclease)
VIKDEKEMEKDDIFKIKKAMTYLAHTSDGVRNVSVMVTNSSLSLLKKGMKEGAVYLFKDVPYFNNTLIVSKETHYECIIDGEHDLLPENQ